MAAFHDRGVIPSPKLVFKIYFRLGAAGQSEAGLRHLR